MTNADTTAITPQGDCHPAAPVSLDAPAPLPFPGYLVIDTETNKLPDWNLPADDPNNPRLAALTIIKTDDALNEVCARTYFVKPDGWEMELEAGAINGLTTEWLTEHGTSIGNVLDDYVALIQQGYPIIAFNVRFDAKVLRGELRRSGRDDLFTITKNSCVMRGWSAHYGGKWPKLAVTYQAVTGKPLEGQHRSQNDAPAALVIARHLLERNALLPPEVHYAKRRP